ncbi:MAG: flagellar hook-length control protein FliK [Thiohalomonadaceae bacterium]
MDLMRLAAERPSLILLSRVAPALLAAWRAGAVLEALVVSADADQGTARVLIQGRALEVRTEVPLQSGQRLSLEAEPRPGHWRLRIPPPPERAVLHQALRQALPRQQPLAPAIQTFVRAVADSRLPPSVRALAAQLTAQVLEPRRLATADGLRQAVERSGIFLEARLAASVPPTTAPALPSSVVKAPPLPAGAPPAGHESVASDLKGLLLRLLHLLRAPTPARPDKDAADPDHAATETLRALTRHAEGALARIELHQLRALPESGEREPSFVLELPFRQGEQLETLMLRIRREPEADGEAEARAPWTITLELGDGKSGPLRAVIAWSGEAVSTRFFAARSELAERIGASLGLLDTRLRAAGLEVGTLEAHTGQASSEERLPQGLLRERV